MYLLIGTLDMGVSKNVIGDILAYDEKVKLLTWINGKNGKEKVLKNTPIIVGSVKSLYKYEEQQILLAKIEGRKNVDHVIEQIKNRVEFEYFVIPLVA